MALNSLLPPSQSAVAETPLQHDLVLTEDEAFQLCVNHIQGLCECSKHDAREVMQRRRDMGMDFTEENIRAIFEALLELRKQSYFVRKSHRSSYNGHDKRTY